MRQNRINNFKQKQKRLMEQEEELQEQYNSNYQNKSVSDFI